MMVSRAVLFLSTMNVFLRASHKPLHLALLSAAPYPVASFSFTSTLILRIVLTSILHLPYLLLPHFSSSPFTHHPNTHRPTKSLLHDARYHPPDTKARGSSKQMDQTCSKEPFVPCCRGHTGRRRVWGSEWYFVGFKRLRVVSVHRLAGCYITNKY